MTVRISVSAMSINARLCLQCKVEFADDCAGSPVRRKFCSHSCYDEWDRINRPRKTDAKRPRDTWMPDLHFESWGECFALVQNGRACEFRSCRHHLGMVPVDDAQPEPPSTDTEDDDTEPVKPDAPVTMEPSNAAKTMCTLIYAYHNPVTLASIARVLSVTRERVRQIEAKGLLKMKRGKRSDVK